MESNLDSKARSDDALKILHLGSGKNFQQGMLNLDINDYWSPDVVADIASNNLIGSSFNTERFGVIMFQDQIFDKIICHDVLEHIPNLVQAMTNCLRLLRLDGSLEILVPYDLSYGAWQDPTHVRAFNERSWLYYTAWHWYLGWETHNFKLIKQDFNPSPFGRQLVNDGVNTDTILRTPRAIDSMSVVLQKQEV